MPRSSRAPPARSARRWRPSSSSLDDAEVGFDHDQVADLAGVDPSFHVDHGRHEPGPHRFHQESVVLRVRPRPSRATGWRSARTPSRRARACRLGARRWSSRGDGCAATRCRRCRHPDRRRGRRTSRARAGWRIGRRTRRPSPAIRDPTATTSASGRVCSASVMAAAMLPVEAIPHLIRSGLLCSVTCRNVAATDTPSLIHPLCTLTGADFPRRSHPNPGVSMTTNHNLVVLHGTVSGDIIERQLPSGSVAVQFDVRTEIGDVDDIGQRVVDRSRRRRSIGTRRRRCVRRHRLGAAPLLPRRRRDPEPNRGARLEGHPGAAHTIGALGRCGRDPIAGRLTTLETDG